MKMYVLVRRDLTTSQQAVQAGHALAKYMWETPIGITGQWANGTLVYLGVENEKHLKKWRDKLEHSEMYFHEWREPDMDNQLTAVAAYGNGRVLKRLDLL